MLMGLYGAGAEVGMANADMEAYFFLGAILVYSGGLDEWNLGNTLPTVAFFTVGGFWGTFGATLIVFFNAINGYRRTLPDLMTASHVPHIYGYAMPVLRYCGAAY